MASEIDPTHSAARIEGERLPVPIPVIDDPRATGSFIESQHEELIPAEILNRRICDFDLRIEGRPLEKIIERFRLECGSRGLTRLAPAFYLTDEWGVPEGTVAIGIPFYLADEQLLRVHGLKGGLIEGQDEEDILRYLRHEMGHVVNYAYRLYASEEWTKLFGPMSRPYTETFRVQPFSTDYVRHLPGGYAQKHPDEDWAETFAVWMTEGSAWREIYVDSPLALRKLEYCDRIIAAIKDKDPDVARVEIDYDAREIRATVQEYYEKIELSTGTIPRSLDGDLKIIFAPRKSEGSQRSGDAAALLRRQQDNLANTVYRWSGVEPELLKQVLAHLIARARALGITYTLAERDVILVEISGFLTTLAMNYIYTGKFIAS